MVKHMRKVVRLQEPSEQLQQIEVLLAKGRKKREIVEDLGLTGLQLDRLLGTVDTTFKDKQLDVTKQVAEDMLGGGKTADDVTGRLGICVATLRTRLKRRGASIPALTKPVNDSKRPSRTSINRQIGVYYRANRYAVPHGGEARWGKKRDLQACRRVYHMMMEGDYSSRKVASELAVGGSVARAIMNAVRDDVLGQSSRDAAEILPLLKGKAVADQERRVFELIGVEGLTEKEAGDTLEVSEARVSLIRSGIIEKFPQLKRVLTQRRYSQRVRLAKEKAAAKRSSEKGALRTVLEKFLADKETHGLAGSITNKALGYSRVQAKALGQAGNLVKAVTTAVDTLNDKTEKDFPERFRRTALIAVITYNEFGDDVPQAISNMAQIGTYVNTAVKDFGLGERLSATVFAQVAEPKYVGYEEAVRARAQEIKSTRDRVMGELGRVNAPRECWGKITNPLMILARPRERGEEILQRVRDSTLVYVDLKKMIVDEGHPVALAENIGVPAISYSNPVKGWRAELDNHLKKERVDVGEKGFVKATQLTDEELLGQVDKARDGDGQAVESFTRRFEPIVKAQAENIQDEKENRDLIAHIITQLPRSCFEKHPVTDFTAYVSYALKVNAIRRRRMRARSQ